MKYLLFVLGIAPAFAQNQWTLDELYARARQNYPAIKQLELIEKSREYSLANANKAYLPQVSITAIGGYIINGLPAMVPGAPSDNGKVKFIGVGQVSQTLWDGGSTGAQKKIIQATSDVNKSEVEVGLYALRERVNQLFFGILVINEQLAQLELHRKNLERNINKVKQSVEQGLAYKSDADELTVESLKIGQRADEFIFTRKAYVAMLSLMIGQEIREDVTLVKPAAEQTLPTSITRPELNFYNSQRQLAMQHNAVSKAAYMPKIGLLGFGVAINPGVSFGSEAVQSLSLAGLSLSWNTMGLYRNRNNLEQTKLSLERINNTQESFLFNTNLQLAQQSNELAKQQAIISKDVEILELRKKIRNAYELKYQSGVCTVTDLILSVNAEGEAGSNKSLHEIQFLMSLYNYKTTSGN